jgi:hypothetical protein
MTVLDERILERLAVDDGGTAWEIAFDLRTDRRRVWRRCRVLADADFVEVIPRGEIGDRYEIMTWGLQYLDGEVDAELRRPTPSPRPPEAVRPGWYAGFCQVKG